ncbi:MAG TPA: YfhO family protein, partial [Candidatus Limnocylindrales bacterium]|nr:YfhO family protein [Candidatus Limnocylindrales bacterium]
RWDYATQWSLPKREALGSIIPGLFGYRMDTPQDMSMFGEAYRGGVYWGAAGRDPSWYRYFESGAQGQQPAGPLRFTGGGNYAGILVAVVALWAAFQGFRKHESVFSAANARWLKFWAVIAIIALLLAFGRFAPFYRILYALPYFSTIRNPAKFMHVLNWALVVLFAYGVHGLWRRYVEGVKEAVAFEKDASPRPSPLRRGEGEAAAVRNSPGARAEGRGQRTESKSQMAEGRGQRAEGKGQAQWSFKGWWGRVRGFDRRWVLGSLAAFAVSVLGWLIYASSRDGVEKYLQQVGFDAEMAKIIAGFSLGQVFWFLVFFAAALGLVTLVLSGAFTGPRAKWAGILLGLFLVVDLGRANLPWIIVWDYQQKYATNPIIDKLRDKPYEHRVAVLPRYFSDPNFVQAFRLPKELADLEQYFQQVYNIEWAQHHFLYYNVQSLDLIQMPRFPEDLLAFESALSPRSVADLPRVTPRRWELTNTRYLLGAARFLELLNVGFDPAKGRFRIIERFQVVPKPGIEHPTKLSQLTAVPATNGNFALFEFQGALPRAKLYSNWQMAVEDRAEMDRLRTNSLSAADLDSMKQAGTNEFLTLKKLASADFDPEKTVLLAEPVPGSPSATGTNSSAETVEFASYAPKDIVLKTQAATPTVLLLNDRYDPNWKVSVDGKPDKLLRCNYLMRGVYLSAGTHRVEFVFQPPMQMFHVSLIAVCTGLLLCGMLLVVREPGPKGTDDAKGRPEPKKEEAAIK